MTTNPTPEAQGEGTMSYKVTIYYSGSKHVTEITEVFHPEHMLQAYRRCRPWRNNVYTVKGPSCTISIDLGKVETIMAVPTAKEPETNNQGGNNEQS